MLDEPEMWGVEQLGASGIALRLVVKTTPSAADGLEPLGRAGAVSRA